MNTSGDGRAADGAREPAAPWVVVTGLDGSGKSALVRRLSRAFRAHRFRLPHHKFVRRLLELSGRGQPFGDVHTDRLLFATDARLTNTLIRDWRASHDLLISQRGWMDNYVFGAVQGVTYEETDALLRTAELERPSAIITLVAEPEVAFGRIRFDPGGDKFETLAFMTRQYEETLRFHRSVRDRLPILSPFFGIPEILIDTTDRPRDAVPPEAERFMDEVLSSSRAGLTAEPVDYSRTWPSP